LVVLELMNIASVAGHLRTWSQVAKVLSCLQASHTTDLLDLDFESGSISIAQPVSNSSSSSNSDGALLRTFGFDRVLGPDATQEEALRAVGVKRIVQSVLQVRS
jgi:hypothetical protein